MYFGFNEEDRSYRQQEIADLLNVKQSSVSRILNRTLIELKTELEDTELGTKERQKRKMKKR